MRRALRPGGVHRGARRGGGRGTQRAARAARHRDHRRLRAAGERGDVVSKSRARRDNDRDARPLLSRRRPPPAAHPRGGGRAREAHRARGPPGEGTARQREPEARRRERTPLREPGAVPPRPDPGGNARTDPRGGEVRLATRLQVLDLRHLLDPPGDATGARQPLANDPHPR